MKISDLMALKMEFDKLQIRDRKRFAAGKRGLLRRIKKQRSQAKKKMKGFGHAVALDPA